MASRLGKALVGSARNTDTSKSVNARFNRAVDKAKGAVKGAKKGLKNRIADAAGSVGDKAIAFSKKMRTEEVETYDVVVEFLCDQGIAEDLQEAQWMMVNEVDSEDIATILEAYGLDEKMIVTRGTSTNAAGEKIPFTHKTNTLTGRSTVSDKFGKNRPMEKCKDR